MIEIDCIDVNGVTYAVTKCELDGRCQPLIDREAMERNGGLWMCYKPGPITIDIRVFAKEAIPVTEKETCHLSIGSGAYTYVGDFECVRAEAIGGLFSVKFHRDGQMTQVPA